MCFENCWKLQGYESGSNIKEKGWCLDNLTSFNSELFKQEDDANWETVASKKPNQIKLK